MTSLDVYTVLKKRNLRGPRRVKIVTHVNGGTPTILQWCQKEFTPLNREKYFEPSGPLSFFF